MQQMLLETPTKSKFTEYPEVNHIFRWKVISIYGDLYAGITINMTFFIFILTRY